jgi:lipid II:glycine glycyltransferase (peptidoglycan interpeptide bridge formation enzyme)
MDSLDKLATHPLQTSYWAEFRRKWGNEVIETPYGIITLHKIPFFNFKIGMFIKGPAPDKEMLEHLKTLGIKNKIIFIKLEPNAVKAEKILNILKSSGAVPGKTLFTPTTFWIDLTPTEEEILKSFSGKTRYNIRVAQKHGVSVQIDNSQKAFDSYLHLTKETAGRQGFYAHSAKYHKLMWHILQNNGIANLLTATYKGKIISTWVLFSWHGFLYYPYGASSDEYKNVMANNLMMWEAIKFGKKQGLTTFDLWGREEGKGFTRFKEGFNPKVVEFLGTWDLVINRPLYKLYIIAEFLRWKFLKFAAKFRLSAKRFQ